MHSNDRSYNLALALQMPVSLCYQLQMLSSEAPLYPLNLGLFASPHTLSTVFLCMLESCKSIDHPQLFGFDKSILFLSLYYSLGGN